MIAIIMDKKRNLGLIFSSLMALSFTACKVSPEPIAYGLDGCYFCSMTIVDKQHASQIVTKKGKSYKFDATECMLNWLNDNDSAAIALFLVNDFDEPGKLIDATKATYLRSENIPSPMGAFLSAFGHQDTAERVSSENQGQLYTWDELKRQFKE